jgi:hypothetical protein
MRVIIRFALDPSHLERTRMIALCDMQLDVCFFHWDGSDGEVGSQPGVTRH